MGVDVQVLRFLLESIKAGISLDSVLMLGRQKFHQMGPRQVSAPLRAAGFTLAEADAARLLTERGGYVEPLLELLGARRIDSLDNSAYEHATIIHDLNEPVPSRLKGTFSLVLDGGSIEHVFNFPQAIKNSMEMVVVGGHYLEITTANNFMGHGFYQLSPELYYRVFSNDNGFAVEKMVLCETDPGAAWYEVADPVQIGRRIELINRRPTYLMMRALKVREAEIFRTVPQQSDYVAQWTQLPKGHVDTSPIRRSILKALAPQTIRRSFRRMFRSGFNSQGYRRA